MMFGTKKILLALLIIFILIQFIQPEKKHSAGTMPDDVFARHPANENVTQLVKRACYDCHSNNTTYPWYASVQPVAWWLDHHVNEGKEELNFSEFANYPAKKANHKMEEVIELIENKEMPLQSYTLLHKDARLTEEQRKAIMDWAKLVRVDIQKKM